LAFCYNNTSNVFANHNPLCGGVFPSNIQSRKEESEMKLYKGYRDKDINSLNETIFYNATKLSKMTSLLYPLMAGITNPDPEYYIRRRQDIHYKHVFVLEYVVSGKGYIESGNHKYTVKEGDFYLLNRYTTPYYYADPNDPYTKIWVNIAGRFVNALAYAYQITEPVLIIHDPSLESYIHRIHTELLNLPSDEKKRSYDAIMNLLLELFQQIDRIRKKEPTIRKSATFKQITDYIYENILLENLDVDYVATYFYMSYSTIYRLCMNHVGLSPKHYILKLKIDYAKTMFSSTNCSVSKAAETLNFSSPLYFSKVFKKYTGYSPTDWKKHEKVTPD